MLGVIKKIGNTGMKSKRGNNHREVSVMEL
jgi:hypothetical protein